MGNFKQNRTGYGSRSASRYLSAPNTNNPISPRQAQAHGIQDVSRIPSPKRRRGTVDVYHQLRQRAEGRSLDDQFQSLKRNNAYPNNYLIIFLVFFFLFCFIFLPELFSFVFNLLMFCYPFISITIKIIANY